MRGRTCTKMHAARQGMNIFVSHTFGDNKCQWINVLLIARFMGPTWGPSGTDMTQVGLMLAPWTLLSAAIWENETAWSVLMIGYCSKHSRNVLMYDRAQWNENTVYMCIPWTHLVKPAFIQWNTDRIISPAIEFWVECLIGLNNQYK